MTSVTQPDASAGGESRPGTIDAFSEVLPLCAMPFARLELQDFCPNLPRFNRGSPRALWASGP